jgi:ATPase subunit of ABC transporter with duplicated ATPase domains
LRNIDYRTYVEERANELAKQEQMHKMQRREYKKDKAIISHQKSAVRSQQIAIKDSAVRRTLNKKMKNILVQERKAREKLVTDRPETEDPIYLSFDQEVSIPNGKRVLDFHQKELRIGKKVLAKDVDLTIFGPEKIVIIGSNGSGKTTLLRELFEEMKSRNDINVGYMPQNYEDMLDPNMVVFDYVVSDLNEVDMDLISAYIGRIKLTWHEMNGKISELSSGQKAKLMILKMMLDKNDVLILDEPTRNLSSISNPVIRDIFSSFGGCIISVSHDRKFIREVCDKVYRLTSSGIDKVEI